MRPYDFRSPSTSRLVAVVLLVSLAACAQHDDLRATNRDSAASATTQSSAPPTNSGTQLDHAALQAFGRRIGVTCEGNDAKFHCITGKPEVGDYLDVELHPDCTVSGLKAKVIGAANAELRDRAAPLDRRTIATLEPGQQLCIQAIGRAGDRAEYYYVHAITMPNADCDKNSSCAQEPWAIQWRNPLREDCSPAELTDGKTRCAAGWVDSESIAVSPR